MYATLDDSLVRHGDVCFYAHFVNHPIDETLPLVIVGRKQVIRQDRLLASYLAAAIDDSPLLACEHYVSYPFSRSLVAAFTNRWRLRDEEKEVQSAFYAADFGACKASRKARWLFRNGTLRTDLAWQEHAGLLLYLPEPLDELTRIMSYRTQPVLPRLSQEGIDAFIKNKQAHHCSVT